MRPRRVVALAFLLSLTITAVLSVRLLHAGRRLSEVAQLAAIMLVLSSLPAVGLMIRSRRPRTHAADASIHAPRRRLLRYVLTFIVAPLSVGVIAYMTYPSPSFIVPAIVVVTVGAFLLFELTR